MRRQRERVLEDWKNEQDRSPCQQIAVSMGGLPTVSFLFCLQTTPLPNSPPLLPSKKKKWRATGFLRAGALCCGCEEKKLVSVIQSLISVKPYPPRAMINETTTAGPVWRRLCVALSRGLLKEAVLGQRRLMWKLATKRRRSAEELLLWTQL